MSARPPFASTVRFASHRVTTITAGHRKCDRCGATDPDLDAECPVTLRRALDRATGSLHDARNRVSRVAVYYCACPIGRARQAGNPALPTFGCGKCETGYIKTRPDAKAPEEIPKWVRPPSHRPPVAMTCSACGHKYTGSAACPLARFHEEG